MAKSSRTRLAFNRVLNRFKRVLIIAGAVVFTFGPVMLLNSTATAAQITSRSLTISSGVPSATGVAYSFAFTPGTAGAIQAFSFQACTTPLGACTAPSGFNIEDSGAQTATFTNFAGTVTSPTQDTTHTPNYTNAQACNSNNVYCVTFTDATSQTTTQSLTVKVNTVTNPSTANSSFYVRIYDWSAAAVTGTPVDNGNVAAAVTQTLTVNATIQELLTFCVGAVSGTTPESVAGAVPACSSMSGTSLNLGTLSYSATSVSPENVANSGGDNNQGVAELTTNAGNGSTVSYNSIQQSGTNHLGALRVAGATCVAGSSATDQCINDANSAPNTITAGTEQWGMAIPGVNCSNVTAYTCNATTHNLVVQSPYWCTSTDASTSSGGSFTNVDAGGQNSGTSTCTYAWDDSGTSNTVATTPGSVKVVNGEALLLEFAATPSITSPTGTYTALANFVATPTF